LIGAILEGVQQFNLSEDEYGTVKGGLYEIQADDYQEFEHQLKKMVGKFLFADKPDGEHGGDDDFLSHLREKFAQDFPANRDQLIEYVLNAWAQYPISEEVFGHLKEAIMALAGTTFEEFGR
jgi:uncharacterized protein (DUF2267 family)